MVCNRVENIISEEFDNLLDYFSESVETSFKDRKIKDMKLFELIEQVSSIKNYLEV